ncbi:MAG: KAP family NTPase [candidate division WOR-3 bacterium]|nr:KAP family NTPase [candidate division WOR-3 bacterium]
MRINYIPDKEINIIEQEDLLGTSPYVETLKEIVQICETPFTIGLLGSWGSGKSSIIKTLQEHFNKNKDDKNKIRVFIYDAWKYSKDDFRRTFILELRRFFNLDIKEEEELFYKDKVEEIQHKPKFDKWSIAIFIVSLILFGFIYYFWNGKSIKAISLIGPLSFSSLITFIYSIFRQVIIYHRVSITTSKIFAPEKFSERFEQTITSIEKKKEINKVIIAIDNIDRCHQELAIEVLLTIKNFLGIKNVVFIVPVDCEGIKKYLKMSNQDANEFLRKLFNTTLTIKNFSDFELYEFALKLSEKYQLNLSPTVLSLISQEFSKNPRRIIQFLNTYQTEVFLAKEQEDKGIIPQSSVTGNLPMLAKLLIIREEWPDLYDLLNDDKTLLQKISHAFVEKNYKFNNEENRWVLTMDNRELKLSEDQYRFLLRTQTIISDNLEPFFVNKDLLIDVPDEINSLVINQDWGRLKELITINQLSLDNLLKFITKKINDDVIKRKLFKTTGYNIVALILKIFNDKDFSNQLKENFDADNKIRSVLSTAEFREIIFNFNPEELTNFALWLTENEFVGLTENIVLAINETKDVKADVIQMVKEFISQFQNYNKYLLEIKSKFSEILKSNPLYYDDFKKLLVNNAETVKSLITEELISSFIDTLNSDFNQTGTAKKVEIIKDLNKLNLLSEKIITNYIEKTLKYIDEALRAENWNFSNFWWTALEGFIVKIKTEPLIQAVFDRLNTSYNKLPASRYNAQNAESYKVIINTTKELYLKSKENRNKISTLLNSYYQQNSPHDLYLLVNDTFQELIDNCDEWTFSDNVISVFKNLQNWDGKKKVAKTLNSMLKNTSNQKGLTENQINLILDQYLTIIINNQPEQVEDAKNWLLEIKENGFIKNKLIDKIKLVTEPIKLVKLFDVINELGDNVLIKNVFVSIVNNVPEDLDSIYYVLSKIKPKVLSDNELELLIDKVIKPSLASNDIPMQEQAIQILSNLTRIPDNKKQLIVSLIDAIDKQNLDEEDNKRIEKINNMLK